LSRRGCVLCENTHSRPSERYWRVHPKCLIDLETRAFALDRLLRHEDERVREAAESALRSERKLTEALWRAYEVALGLAEEV
jgi:hypothetical protein